MELCDDGHDQVVHDGQVRCPVCTANDELDELKGNALILAVQVEGLEETMRNLEDRVSAAEEG
jgi:uncharacterized Zn finger protein (UPF0148 family)